MFPVLSAACLLVATFIVLSQALLCGVRVMIAAHRDADDR
jgi:hypothetical protein